MVLLLLPPLQPVTEAFVFFVVQSTTSPSFMAVNLKGPWAASKPGTERALSAIKLQDMQIFGSPSWWSTEDVDGTSCVLDQWFSIFFIGGIYKLITKTLRHTKTCIALPIWPKIGIILIHSPWIAIVVLAVAFYLTV